jgi:DNA-binding beta-propeller fold protein YncE
VNHIVGSPQTINITYDVVAAAVNPRMTLDRSVVAVEGFILDPGAPETQTVDATYTGLGSSGTFHVSASSTSNVVTGVTHTAQSSVSGPRTRISIQLKAPIGLSPGIHTDTVTARACLDANCVNEMAGSPATISVQYTISDSTSGADGFTARTIAAVANDLVWDTQRQLLYVSMAQTAPSNANTIGVLDPVTGTFSTFAPTGIDPGKLAISANGEYLYVGLRGSGSIQRLLLPALSPDLTIPLGTRSVDGAPLYVKEMHVAPDAPQTIAVVRSGSVNGLGAEWDLAIFDDAQMRPLVVVKNAEGLFFRPRT